MIVLYKLSGSHITLKTAQVQTFDEIPESTTCLILLYKDLDEIKESNILADRKKKVIVVDDRFEYEREDEVLALKADYYVDYTYYKNRINALLTMLNEKFDLISNINFLDNLFLVEIKGQSYKLAPKEYNVYKYLTANRGKLCLRKEIITEVLGYHSEIDSRLVDVYIKYIREKLPTEAKKIETVRGKGYIYHY